MRAPLLFVGMILFLSLTVCAGCAGTGTPALASSSDAAKCNEPVLAPHYQIGEKFTWAYTNSTVGKKRSWEVTGFEGNLAQIKWNDENMQLDREKEGMYFIDPDWVIQKAISKKAEVILSPTASPAFMTLGLRYIDFPLQIGKSWKVMYAGRGTLSGNIRTYLVIFEVVACEEISTPAGKFLALKIQSDHNNGAGSSGTANRWYAPDAKNFIKLECVPNPDYWGTPPPDYELIGLDLKEGAPRTLP